MEDITPLARKDPRNSVSAVLVRQGLTELLPRLRRLARALAGHVADADDLVQMTLERALEHADQWRPEARLDAWVFGILRNAWRDEVRARGRWSHVIAPEEAGASVGVASIEHHADALSIAAAMARLPDEQREALALVLVEGLSYAEAAKVLDVPVGTVTSRLARGRSALQRLLGEE